uniref:Major head protein n=1 Tax=Siphoviridae sp. ctkKt3 TaxID=2825642 RepID=A0A8S5UYT8_9CAUD|nr:MAG TPA: Major head protein [Siphoviridae sp. ctkKt3]
MAFEAITTQEQLDSIIGERLKRERETVEKKLRESIEKEYLEKYGDYEELKTKTDEYGRQIEGFNQTIKENSEKIAGYEKSSGEMQAKLKKYEMDSMKMKIAHEAGIPFELASRLSGEDEAAIRKDAESISKFISKKKTSVPLASTEPEKLDSKQIAMKSMLDNLKGE